MTAHVDAPEVEQGNHARVADPGTWPEHIKRRYGVRSGGRRRAVVVTVVVGLLAVPFAARAAWKASSEQGVLQMPAFRTVGAGRVDLDLAYASKPGVFTCAVRAQDGQRVDVGFAYLVVRPGESRTWTYPMRTRGSASAAAVIGCQPGVGTDRLPAPQFAPGVKPPTQPAPGIAPKVEGGFATVAP